MAVLLGTTCMAQDAETNTRKLSFGFNVGANYSNLFSPEPLPSNASISNNVGVRIGLISAYHVAPFFSIAPKAELSFNSANVAFDGINPSRYKVFPVNLDFATHLVFRLPGEKRSPYFYVGPNIKVPVQQKVADTEDFGSQTDFAIDFGIGFENHFQLFNMAPEIRYSMGLRNVNENPALQSLHFHNIALILNFTD